MLDQHDLEQYDRINARPAVILAVQILYKLIDFFEIDCPINLPEQMILWNHILQTHNFYLSSIFCILDQHFSSPHTIIPHFLPSYQKKAIFR